MQHLNNMPWRPSDTECGDQKTRDNRVKIRYQDECPVHVCNQNSINKFNEDMLLAQHHDKKPTDVRFFRPNILVDGVESYGEDQWRRFRIGNLELQKLKQTDRCMVTVVDPDLGERDSDLMPIFKR